MPLGRRILQEDVEIYELFRTYFVIKVLVSLFHSLT
jgi:hypothetical protein